MEESTRMPNAPRVAMTLTQDWHRVPGGTAVAANALARALCDTGGVSLTGVGPAGPPPEKPWNPPVDTRALGLRLPWLYEAWDRLRRPRVTSAVPDAELVHLLAHHPDATWRRLVTDSLSGSLLDVGTTRYRPPAPLGRHVRLRDVTCRWPGCLCPAERCDLDHTSPWPNGDTSAENLTALCRRHHRLKTFGRYRVERSDRDETVVVGPLGRQLLTTPHDYRSPPVVAVAGPLSRPATAPARRGAARAPG